MSPPPTSRLPIPPGAKTVLLFGGAFDPPHRAHVGPPIAARDAVGADLLLYMPAAAPPLKEGPVAGESDRVEMLKRALDGLDRVAISTLEIERAGTSYTADTLRALKAERPETTFRLLIGADQARQFHRWRDPRAIIDLAEPVVMLRPPRDDADALLRDMTPRWSAEELEAWRARLVETPLIEASSTEARRLLVGRGPAAPELPDLLPDQVLAYIRDHNLYRA